MFEPRGRAAPFAGWIEKIRRRLGARPRRFSLRQRFANHIRKPIWLPPSDPLIEHYYCRAFLLEEGAVVWGSLVQANDALFEPGAFDAPAMVIYSLESSWSDELVLLEAMAQELFKLKEGERLDPEEEQYGDMLADEFKRALGWSIPRSIAGDHHVRSTGIMVHRKHLPGRTLTSTFLPVLAHPDSRMVFVVPADYWSEDLVEEFGVSRPP